MKLTKKQVSDFARMYVGSQMMNIDGDNLGEIEASQEDKEKIVEAINRIGRTTLGNRPFLQSPKEILMRVLDQ